MKKICSIFALSSLLFAGVAAAQDDTNAVYSANAVGVIKYTIPAGGGMACISLPMHSMDDSAVSGWVWGTCPLAQQLEDYSAVYFWQDTGWQPSIKYPKKGWSQGGGDYVIQPGEAFFVQSPSGSTSNKVITLLGEVPTENYLEYALTGSDNFDTRSASMYPVGVTFGQTVLASNLLENSSVYFWRDGGWQPSVKYPKKGWSQGGADQVVAPGEGLFIRSAATEGSTVRFTRPFEW